MNTHIVSGPVSLETFATARQAGEAAIAAAGGEPLTFDMSRLESTNSLAVALLTAWFRAADSAGCEVRFADLSAELRQVVEFSGLADVLPIAAAPER
ncbi:MAG: STAS domain-containing protein [Pseudomonadota bacterium]